MERMKTKKKPNKEAIKSTKPAKRKRRKIKKTLMIYSINLRNSLLPEMFQLMEKRLKLIVRQKKKKKQRKLQLKQMKRLLKYKR